MGQRLAREPSKLLGGSLLHLIVWTAIGISLHAVIGGLLLRRPLDLVPQPLPAPEQPAAIAQTPVAARKPLANVLPPALPPKLYEMEPASVIALLSSGIVVATVVVLLLLTGTA